MARPLVAVTGPDHGGLAAWHATRLALRAAGARAVRVTPSRPALPDDACGMVLGGGADLVPPGGESPREAMSQAVKASRAEVAAGRTPWRSLLTAPATLALRRVLAARSALELDPRRDELERQLYGIALARHWPVLGICRGAQLMSLCAGGSLFDDIQPLLGESPRSRTVLPRVRIHVEQHSRLARILNALSLSVNALHHQAIRSPGSGFQVVARTEEGGLVQAIERPDRPLVLGVQWHPEYLPQHPRQRALFRTLVDEARKVPWRESNGEP